MSLRLTFLEVLLQGYLAAKGRMNLVQVGANDGRINDPIHAFVMRNRALTRILLIEPQPEIIPFLKQNYAAHPDAHIHQGAIGPDDNLRLFRVKPALWAAYNPPYMKDAPAYRVPSGFTSSSIAHVRRHAEGNFRIEARLDEDPRERQALLNELDELDRLANQTTVPLAHADELYALRSNIEKTRRRLLTRKGGAPQA